jgi:hypothetical protein
MSNRIILVVSPVITHHWWLDRRKINKCLTLALHVETYFEASMIINEGKHDISNPLG